MSTPEACPRNKELVPLEHLMLYQENRPQAVERCIAPLMALSAITAFDEYRDTDGIGHIREQFLLNDKVSEIYLPMAIANMGIVIKSSPQLNFSKSLYTTEDQDRRTLNTQREIIDRFMFYGAESIDTSVGTSIHDQAYMLGKLILPSVLDIKKLPHTPSNTANLLRSNELNKICRTLSFSANGAWAGISTLSNHDVMSVPQTVLGEYMRKNKDLDENLLMRIELSDMFTQSEDDEVIASDAVVKILRKYMKLDNEHAIANGGQHMGAPSRLNGSRGCPASIKSVRMLPDDLTPSQMERLTQGENPIASYDPRKQIFTLLRSPIREFNLLLADILDPTYRPQA